MTATPARIRRCNRESAFAFAQSTAVQIARPDAKPIGEDTFTRESFFDYAEDAQLLETEAFAIRSSIRISQAVETQAPMDIGTAIPIAPKLPRVRLIDKARGLDRLFIISGLAIDFNAERNSIEAIG